MRDAKPRYVAKPGETSYPFSSEMIDLMRRRTMPFLDGVGLATRPLAQIVQEAYLQGIKDACDALEHRTALATET